MEEEDGDEEHIEEALAMLEYALENAQSSSSISHCSEGRVIELKYTRSAGISPAPRKSKQQA